MDPDRLKQLELAKQLRSQFQSSGSFKADSSGQGRQGRQAAQSSYQPNRNLPTPAHHQQQGRQSLTPAHQHRAQHQQGYSPAVMQPRNPNLGRASANTNQPSSSENKKRKINDYGGKMDYDTGNFFADRPNTAEERGNAQYYQEPNRATAPAVQPISTAFGMATNAPTPAATFGAPSVPTNTPMRAQNTNRSGFSLIDTSPPPAMAATPLFQPLNPSMFQSTAAEPPRQQPATMGTAKVVGTATHLHEATQPAAPAAHGNGAAQAGVFQGTASTSTGAADSQRIAYPKTGGPIIFYYQDPDAKPELLPPTDEEMMDVDMADANTGGVLSERAGSHIASCICPKPSAGGQGLQASRLGSVDDNCPQHGKYASKRNGYSGGNHENRRGGRGGRDWFH